MEFKLNIEEINKDESLRKAIIDECSEMLREDMAREVEKAVSAMIKDELKKQIEERVRARVDMILIDAIDEEFTPVNKWGEPDKPVTIRNQIVEIFKEQTTFKKTRWDSDRNAFTKVLEEIIQTEVRKASSEYNRIIDSEFLENVHKEAIDKLKKRLKLK